MEEENGKQLEGKMEVEEGEEGGRAGVAERVGGGEGGERGVESGLAQRRRSSKEVEEEKNPLSLPQNG